MREWMRLGKARGPAWAISTPNNNQVLFPLRNPLETYQGWMRHQYDTENNQQLEREHPFPLSLSRRLSQKKWFASLLNKNHAKPFPRNFRRMGTSEKPARTQSFFSDHMSLWIGDVAAQSPSISNDRTCWSVPKQIPPLQEFQFDQKGCLNQLNLQSA